MLAQKNTEQHKPTKFEIVFHGIIWAFVGALYAALFIPVFEVAKNVFPLWVAPIFATVAATVGGALVYSSSQLALLVAMFSNFAVFGYLLYSGEFGSPLPPIAVGAVIGSIIGGLYGLSVKESRIYSAEAKLFASATVGILVSSISLIWILVFNASLMVLVMVIAPLSGLIYILIVDNFIRRFSDVLPPTADGAVAGIVIGGFIGFGLWVMGTIALENAPLQWQNTIELIAQSTPLSIVAAAISTFLGGILHEVFRHKF